MKKEYSTFDFYVASHYFPGYAITIPFYLEVEYEYTSDGKFSRVIGIKIIYAAISCLRLSHTLALEIETAARQHLENTFTKSEDDVKGTEVFQQSEKGREIDITIQAEQLNNKP